MDKYDTLEYSWVKAITLSVCLRNFLCALINTNIKHYVSSFLLNYYSGVFISFQNKTQSFHCMTLSSLSVYVVFVDPY
jgi:hypothetical protein